LDAVAAATDTAAVASWRGGAAVVGQLDASDCDVAPARRAEAPAAGASADDPEALILARCSAQIAAEAGPGAVVHAIGARRQAALLDAAVAALPQSRRGGAGGAGGSRCIVYLPRSVAAARSADALLALLQRAAGRAPRRRDRNVVGPRGRAARSARPHRGLGALPALDRRLRAPRAARARELGAGCAPQGALIRVTPPRVST
jgi:hypothetical protein